MRRQGVTSNHKLNQFTIVLKLIIRREGAVYLVTFKTELKKKEENKKNKECKLK